jgi:hypothetical protein
VSLALPRPIRLALRELGYVEGQNIAVEYRYAEGKVDWLLELAGELVGRVMFGQRVVKVRPIKHRGVSKSTLESGRFIKSFLDHSDEPYSA